MLRILNRAGTRKNRYNNKNNYVNTFLQHNKQKITTSIKNKLNTKRSTINYSIVWNSKLIVLSCEVSNENNSNQLFNT